MPGAGYLWMMFITTKQFQNNKVRQFAVFFFVLNRNPSYNPSKETQIYKHLVLE